MGSSRCFPVPKVSTKLYGWLLDAKRRGFDEKNNKTTATYRKTPEKRDNVVYWKTNRKIKNDLQTLENTPRNKRYKIDEVTKKERTNK